METDHFKVRQFRTRTLFAATFACALLTWWVLGQTTSRFTGNDFDLAIVGAGYFPVLTSDGEFRYVRRGRFRVDQANKVVTQHGYQLFPIVLPNDTLRVAVTADGTVYAVTQSAGRIAVGGIILSAWKNPNDVVLDTSLEGEYFTSVHTPDIKYAPGTNGLGKIHQGYLEMTNREWISTFFE